MKAYRHLILQIAASIGFVAVLGAAAAWIELGDADRGLASPRSPTRAPLGGPFSLTDDTGRTVTDRTFRGKWELVYFGDTFCPDACPARLAVIADALHRLGPLASKVQPLFITVDPERDKPTVVGAYARGFDPRIVGLTGNVQAIADVAREYKVFYAVHRTGSGPDDYFMDHSAFVYVVNPDGKFVRVLGGSLSGEEMAARLHPLLARTS